MSDEEFRKAYEDNKKIPILTKTLLVIFGFWQVADLAKLASDGTIHSTYPVISALIDCWFLIMIVYAILKE